MTLTRLVLGAVVRPALVVGAAALVLLGIGTLAQALLQSAVVPDPDLLLRMAAASIGIAAPLAVLVGAIAGAAAGGRALRDDGAVLAISSLGVSPWRLHAVAAGFGAAAAIGLLVSNHVAEPLARATFRDAKVQAAVRVDPVEGRTLQLGTWAVAVEGGRLHFAGDGGIGSAERWVLEPARAGLVARLAGVVVRAPDRAWTAAADALVLPVVLPGTSGKVHVTERLTPDLVSQLRAHPGDRYEEWILWKRSVLPAALVLMVLGAFGFGVGRRLPVPGAVGIAAIGLWAVVRVCDQAIGGLGVSTATAIVMAVAGIWATAGTR